MTPTKRHTYDCNFCGRKYTDSPEVESRICSDDSCPRFWEELGIMQDGSNGVESMNKQQLIVYCEARLTNDTYR